jgi:Right handed beta helix region
LARWLIGAVALCVALMTSHRPIEPRAATAAPVRSCEASDAAGFAQCLTSANAGQIDRIVVTGRIDCPASAACAFVLRPVGPLTVVGLTSDAGFVRTPDSSLPYGLRIEHAAGPVVIRNLEFDMGRSAFHGPPGQIWTDDACPTRTSCPEAAIAIVGSTDVLVDQVQVLDAKRFAISIVGSSHVTIRRSTFTRSALHAIWVAQQPASRGLHIENNLFVDTRSNAAMLSGAAPDASDPLVMNTVTGNVFDHNHNAAVYHVCGPSGHDPCAGGQLDIERHSDAFLVADNEFRHGILDEDPSLAKDYRVSGVEIAPVAVHDVTIRHNWFHDLTAPAVSVDSPTAAPELRITDNAFDHVGGHGAPIDQAGKVREAHDNCTVDPQTVMAREGGPSTSSSCPWTRPTGRLELSGGTLRWHVQHANQPIRLIADGKRILAYSSAGDGDCTIPQNQPTRIDLYARATLLDTMDMPVRQ